MRKVYVQYIRTLNWTDIVDEMHKKIEQQRQSKKPNIEYSRRNKKKTICRMPYTYGIKWATCTLFLFCFFSVLFNVLFGFVAVAVFSYAVAVLWCHCKKEYFQILVHLVRQVCVMCMCVLVWAHVLLCFFRDSCFSWYLQQIQLYCCCYADVGL